MKEQKIKFGLTVPYIVIFVIIIASIVLWGICSGPRQRSFFECEKKIAETILNFKLAVFSDEPILMRDAKNIYYPSELEQLLIANYGLGKDFQYSPLFIIIQLNRSFFSHLRQNYKLFVVHKYVDFKSKYYQASYALVINNEDEYIGDKSEIFPLLMDRICIEKIEVNGRPLLEILGLSSDGIFINKKAEDEFLKMVAKLQEK